uniref:Amino acid transporter transmembrane domain-containing protein n=1 Tax=Chromera velia CCMP2878 TaxID=1169474 RepID=A0A0G4HJR2_9ALVE|eukprot:Cvel_28225.t1-p1 / transcript=Cvel_28225.t1 / gene=Cvel_28225 / organism=Chromera_velia_CCMP2878 / gene_product=Vacuolar amino acid transporter 1, putative / transcript_product=Vacuolar amino acid transporter 1, putative / location=Cvel_scaffold3655:4862-11101(+) / protein_length=525 / sequence_SO=supercontig / SO=protein_coding / is_pseudo=false
MKTPPQPPSLTKETSLGANSGAVNLHFTVSEPGDVEDGAGNEQSDSMGSPPDYMPHMNPVHPQTFSPSGVLLMSAAGPIPELDFPSREMSGSFFGSSAASRQVGTVDGLEGGRRVSGGASSFAVSRMASEFSVSRGGGGSPTSASGRMLQHQHHQGEPEDKQNNAGSVVSSVFNSVNVLVGVGLLSFPYCAKMCGWIPSFGLLVFFVVTTYWTGIILKDCVDVDKARFVGFAEMAEGAFGKCAKLMIFWMFTLELFTLAGMYMILMLENLPIGVGLVAVGFSGHSCFPLIYSSLAKPEKWRLSVTWAYLVTVSMYAGIMALGYLMFGTRVNSEVSRNLAALDTFAFSVGLVLLVLNPFGKIAVTLAPVAVGVDALYLHRVSPAWRSFAKSVVRTGLTFGVAAAAAVVPSFEQVTALMGALFTIPISLTLPCLVYLKFFGDQIGWGKKILLWLLVLISFVLVPVGLVGVFMENGEEGHAPLKHVGEAIEETTTAAAGTRKFPPLDSTTGRGIIDTIESNLSIANVQ